MSEVSSGKGGLVFGTAGHIDHGKTTLVRALTGVDTDRLAEEKRRGISIDLGFADLTLPGGSRVALIDVPGHERFIKNMLAGTGGIDAVLLIVAADEGVMPQTREHFEICRLLGVERGIVVITKVDLAGEAQVQNVRQQIGELVRSTFLESAPIAGVSARTGTGIASLLGELVRLAASIEPRSESQLTRLPVDRSFTMQGFGTVLTGTLIGGSLKAGETVELHPLRKQFRIRGLQVHRKPVLVASAGQRTAVNLAGVESREIKRGFVVVKPDTFDETRLFDARVEWIDSASQERSRQTLRLYAGALETAADVRLVVRLSPGETLARISVREPLIAVPRDRFVLRNAETTVGGGVVIDAFPPTKMNRQQARQRLMRLMEASEAERLRLLVDESGQGRRLTNLSKLTGWTVEKVRRMAVAHSELIVLEEESRILSAAWLEQKKQQVLAWLASFHRNQPAAKGAPNHLFRSALMTGIEPSVIDFVLRSIPEVRSDGVSVALKSHTPQLSPEEAAARRTLEALFLKAGLEPPSMKDALTASPLTADKARVQLEALIKERKLVRVGPDLIFHAQVLEHVRRSLAAHKGRRFSIPEFKTWTNISRKYAIPLLEFLDRAHVTRREGDARVVL